MQAARLVALRPRLVEPFEVRVEFRARSRVLPGIDQPRMARRLPEPEQRLQNLEPRSLQALPVHQAQHGLPEVVAELVVSRLRSFYKDLLVIPNGRILILPELLGKARAMPWRTKARPASASDCSMSL